MPLNLDGLFFNQIIPDNSGGAEFDTDLDGTATQEDEFISFTNGSAVPLDVTGWQVWSISTGSGAPDAPRTGLFHTFPSGTTLAPGETLYVINEITGTPRNYAQEASQGGVQSGAGGVSTNLLTEGNGGSAPESVALLNPATGQYIIFNMSTSVPNYAAVPGFPAGSTLMGTVNGHAVQDDAAAGFSYQYDPATGGYTYKPAFLPCFAQGTLIETPDGPRRIETLSVGDLVLTADTGPQPILWLGSSPAVFDSERMEKQRPVAFEVGSLGPGLPVSPLVVSPQHRILMADAKGAEVLCPAAGLVGRKGVRRKLGLKSVTYLHLLLPAHGIITANGVLTESFYPGPQALDALTVAQRLLVLAYVPQLDGLPARARPFLSVQETERFGKAALRPVSAGSQQGQRQIEPV